MQVRLTEGEQARLRYTTTTNVAAWSLWIQGLNYYHNSFTGITQACSCWEKALALDPGSAPLNATLGFLHFVDARHGLTQEPRESAILRGRWQSILKMPTPIAPRAGFCFSSRGSTRQRPLPVRQSSSALACRKWRCLGALC
jgi:hypothetical protein